MEQNQNSEILQLHYYLSNSEHSMNARVYNKVEAELLTIIDHVSLILDLDVTIELQAIEEGGIKSIYRFINKKENRRQIVIVGAFFAGIIGTILSDVIAEKIKSDPEMERLKREKLELEIQLLKRELYKTNQTSDNENNNSIIDDEFKDSLSIYISELNQVKISKSKFYQLLLKEHKVEKISTQELNDKYEPIAKEKIVYRKDFNRFIITHTEIDSDYQYNVEVEIVSPVLKKNKMTWRALYNGDKITFTLNDDNFKNAIISKHLQFSNGTKIICDLETKQKMSDSGEIIKVGRVIHNVSQIISSDGFVINI